MSIFSDMVEDTIEVFMDDFSVVDDSFDRCLVTWPRFSKDVKIATLC